MISLATFFIAGLSFIMYNYKIQAQQNKILFPVPHSDVFCFFLTSFSLFFHIFFKKIVRSPNCVCCSHGLIETPTILGVITF